MVQVAALLCASVGTWIPALREAGRRLARICRGCCGGTCERHLWTFKQCWGCWLEEWKVHAGSVLCKCVTKVTLVRRYSSCGHQIVSCYRSLISVYCRMASFGLNILVCISKCRKYGSLGGTLSCFFIGIICQWVVWYWAGLNLASYCVNWDERQVVFFFLNVKVMNRFLIIHFVCVCQACGSATKKCLYVCIALCF